MLYYRSDYCDFSNKNNVIHRADSALIGLVQKVGILSVAVISSSLHRLPTRPRKKKALFKWKRSGKTRSESRSQELDYCGRAEKQIYYDLRTVNSLRDVN